jgi:hypothetical protein
MSFSAVSYRNIEVLNDPTDVVGKAGARKTKCSCCLGRIGCQYGQGTSLTECGRSVWPRASWVPLRRLHFQRDVSRNNYQVQKMQPTGIEPETLAGLNIKVRRRTARPH